MVIDEWPTRWGAEWRGTKGIIEKHSRQDRRVDQTRCLATRRANQGLPARRREGYANVLSNTGKETNSFDSAARGLRQKAECRAWSRERRGVATKP